ncbi:MAG: LacI family DNA-binding transcriptional regulator [Pseudomonadota bacterium]
MMSFDWKDWRKPALPTPARTPSPDTEGEPLLAPGLPLRHARVVDIAAYAGVGTATVDRVLNRRARVRETTRQRVLQAKAAIESGRWQRPANVSDRAGSRTTPWRVRVMLPAEAGPSTEYLASAFQSCGAAGGVTVECEFTRKMEPALLARKLRACTGQRVDAVAFQALDDPRVHQAVEAVSAEGVPCLAVASGLANPALSGYVGVDNLAAGRTAGYLMAKWVAGGGDVAVVSGGQLYRCHDEREMGFRAALRPHAGRLRLVGPFSGDDDDSGNEAVVAEVLERYPALVGVYNVGGGNAGLVRALEQRGVARELAVIAHNLTAETRDFLLDEAIDIVIHQDMRRVAEDTVAALVATLEQRPHTVQPLRVEVITRENTQNVFTPA